MVLPLRELRRALRSRYRLGDVVGSGGMGVVFRADDIKHSRPVAIKVLTSDLPTALTSKRFVREIRIAAQLSHPHILPLHDSGEGAGFLYYVMPFVEGDSLAARLKREGRLPVEEALRIAAEVADALSYAHGKGIVHRDIKPANILLHRGHALIADFGIAKAIGETISGSSITATGIVIGTPLYMSPEQAAGTADIGAATDIYSLGCVLYEMLSGRVPHAAASAAETIARKMTEPARSLRGEVDIAGEIDQLLMKALSSSPSERPASAAEVSATLQRNIRWGAGRSNGSEDATVTAERIGMRSLAVLPFANVARREDQDYLVAGIHDAILSELAQFDALRVISRTSVMRYAHTEKTLAQIARELDVHFIIEGSVFRAADKLHIQVRLLQAFPQEKNVWARSYERDVRELPRLHNELAMAIAHEIKLKLTFREESRAAATLPVDPQAYDAYLKGLFYWHKQSPQAYAVARKYYELALERDPKCALAYCGLGYYWGVLGVFGMIPPRVALSEARAAALKAVEIDDGLAEGHHLLGAVRFQYEWDWAEGERELRRAIELKPGFSDSHCFYSDLLLTVGRVDEAEREMNQALDLDPYSLFLHNFRGWHLVLLRRYGEAERRLRHVLEEDPNFVQSRYALWPALHHLGGLNDALAEATLYFQTVGDHEVAEALLTHEKSDYAGAMSHAARILEERSISGYVQPTLAARVAMYAQDQERAVRWLEKGFEIGEPLLYRLRLDPDWDPLRTDPRFGDLVRRMNYPTDGRPST